MKDALTYACARNPPTRRGSICGGLTAKSSPSCYRMVAGIRRKAFERGTNYD